LLQKKAESNSILAFDNNRPILIKFRKICLKEDHYFYIPNKKSPGGIHDRARQKEKRIFDAEKIQYCNFFNVDTWFTFRDGFGHPIHDQRKKFKVSKSNWHGGQRIIKRIPHLPSNSNFTLDRPNPFVGVRRHYRSPYNREVLKLG